jgi:energy-coupling factor transporter ATP-binding protein EcfA2
MHVTNLPNLDALHMRDAGRMAYLAAQVDDLARLLSQAPDWSASTTLLAEADWLQQRLGQLEERMERKLVVAIVGPSGVGKSTLLNALAGRILSPMGLERPTTREFVIYASSASEAETLRNELTGAPVRIALAPDSAEMQALVLLDTPDTNTLTEHQRFLSQALEHVDVLLTVFTALNPRLYDNIRFLAPFVRLLPPEAVIPVVNMVDRVPLQELERDVLPDFARALEAEWGLRNPRIYLTAARTSLPAGGVIHDEAPLHARNDLDALRTALFASREDMGQVLSDQRLAQGERLVALLREHCLEMLASVAVPRRAVAPALSEFAANLAAEVRQALARHTQRLPTGLHAALWSSLAERAWGPIGWLAAVWALLLRAGAWLGRLGSRRADAEDAAPYASLARGQLTAAWQTARQNAARAWPAVGDGLVAAGFGLQARLAAGVASDETATSTLARLDGAVRERLQSLAAGLGAWPVQWLLNLPVLGLLVWIGYEALSGFVRSEFLPEAYFRHAGLALLTAWGLSFCLLQLLVGMVTRFAFRRRLAIELAESLAGEAVGGWLAQLDVLDALERACTER